MISEDIGEIHRACWNASIDQDFHSLLFLFLLLVRSIQLNLKWKVSIQCSDISFVILMTKQSLFSSFCFLFLHALSNTWCLIIVFSVYSHVCVFIGDLLHDFHTHIGFCVVCQEETIHNANDCYDSFSYWIHFSSAETLNLVIVFDPNANMFIYLKVRNIVFEFWNWSFFLFI